MHKRFLQMTTWVGLSVMLSATAVAQTAADVQAQIQRLNRAAQGTPSPDATPTVANTQQQQTALPPQVTQQRAAAQQSQTAGKTAAKQPTLSQTAFANMAQGVLPMSPAQIKALRILYDETQRAAAAPAGVPPTPTSTSLLVNLAPGATPPAIRLTSGFVTSLVFLDATGAPWPIKAYDLGNPSAFNIQWNKKSNTLMVQAVTQYRVANLAVVLKGLNTPVMLTLVPGQQQVDYRVDLRVPGLGPDAKPTVVGLPGAANPALLNLLDGIPPDDSAQLKVSMPNVEAWLLNNKMYIRTRMSILSPGWISTMSSADGMHAYEMVPTPVVLASLHGKTTKFTIQGF